MSAQHAPLFTAMLAVQKEVKHAIKDSKNPHLRNTYASLGSVIDAVKEICNKNGLVILQRLSGGPNCVIVHTTIAHAESGEEISDALPVPVKDKYDKEGNKLGPDAQEMGSAITYGRRYGLQAMFNIAAEDDDGEVAVNSKPAAPPQTPATKTEKAADPSAVAAVQEKLKAGLGFNPKK